MLVTDEILAYYLKSILGNPSRIIELDGKEKNLQKDDIVVYKENSNINFYKMKMASKMIYPELAKCEKLFLNAFNKDEVKKMIPNITEIKKKILGTI